MDDHSPSPAPHGATFFYQALALLGSTGEEQAEALGVSRRTIGRYEQQLPRVLQTLLDHPVLLCALLLDALVRRAGLRAAPADGAERQ